jgi:hypothetical protein
MWVSLSFRLGWASGWFLLEAYLGLQFELRNLIPGFVLSGCVMRPATFNSHSGVQRVFVVPFHFIGF